MFCYAEILFSYWVKKHPGPEVEPMNSLGQCFKNLTMEVGNIFSIKQPLREISRVSCS